MRTALSVRVGKPTPPRRTKAFMDFAVGEFLMVNDSDNEAVGVKVNENHIAWVKMADSVCTPPPMERTSSSKFYYIPTAVDIVVTR